MKLRSWSLVSLAAVFAASSLLACFSSDQAQPPEDGGLDATAPDDGAAPADAATDSRPPTDGPSSADAGSDAPSDAALAPCTVQAYLQALGANEGGTLVAHDFTCTAGIDLDASTATLDPSEGGWARAPQAFQFESTGDGGAGAYASDAGPVPDGGWPQGAPPIASGVQELTSFDLETGNPMVSGDLTLHVAGPFTLANYAYLYVQGNLVIVATGPITICGGLYAAGNVTIHQPTAAGVTFGCQVPSDDAGHSNDYTGSLYAGYQGDGLTAISPGDVDIATRGAFQIKDGYVYGGAFGSGAQARGGNITVRAYGDINLGSTISDGYMYAGSPCDTPGDAGACDLGTNGNIRFSSEGKITINYDSYLYAGDLSSGAQGGNLSLRSLGGIAFGAPYNGYVYAGAAGNVELLTQGALTLAGGSYAYSGQSAATSVDVLAQSVSLTGDSYLVAQGPGGSVTVNAAGDVTLDQLSQFLGSDSQCVTGGSVTINTEGNLSILNGSNVAGGASTAGSSCSAAAGGNVVATVAGTITAPVPDGGTPPFAGGVGSPVGSVTQTPGAAVDVGVLDAQLEPSVSVVSLPIVGASPSLLFGQLGTTDPANDPGAHLLVATGSAGAFVPVSHAVDQPLSSGWRYKVLLQPRMFDPSAVDGLAIRIQ